MMLQGSRRSPWRVCGLIAALGLAVLAYLAIALALLWLVVVQVGHDIVDADNGGEVIVAPGLVSER